MLLPGCSWGTGPSSKLPHSSLTRSPRLQSFRTLSARPTSNIRSESDNDSPRPAPFCWPFKLQEGAEPGLYIKFLQKRLAVPLTTAVAACGLALSQLPAQAEDFIRFPASANPAVFGIQKTLVEAWTIVNEAYVDAGFGGHNWEKELGDALLTAYSATDASKAYGAVETMLNKLGDPFTRIVTAPEYANFRVSSDGEVQGVGLLIASDPSSGRLIVLAPISGGPADRAGMRPGDEVLTIDGQSTDGWDGDQAAKILRGKSGSSVDVRFARRTEQTPGVAGRPEEPLKRLRLDPDAYQYKQVNLMREKLELTPVYSTAMEHDGHTVGYIRLVSFSQKAAVDTQHAIASLQEQGATGFILDLRNNPGGLVRAGLDIARLWLDGPSTIFNVEGRTEPDGNVHIMQRVNLDEGPSVNQMPLVVLLNGNSASASEILAGALHDNHRASLIGDPTYGKGKIQSVFELADGSALFVTVAKYKTPNMQEIDKVGIRPDMACAPSVLMSPKSAERQSSVPRGVPVDAETAREVASQLQTDACVLTAEHFLDPLLTASKPPVVPDANQIPALSAIVQPAKPTSILP